MTKKLSFGRSRGFGITPVSAYTPDQLEKIGNAIIYLCERIKPLYKTKLLKLLYLLDEAGVREVGIPVLGLEYRVWKRGPVARDVFIELSDSPDLLKDYISVELNDNHTLVKAKRKFNDDEFSDRDLDLMERVVRQFGRMSAERLVRMVHSEEGLWYQAAKANGLLELFEKDETNSSDVVIDLGQLVAKDEVKAFMHKEHQEFQRVHRALKR